MRLEREYFVCLYWEGFFKIKTTVPMMLGENGGKEMFKEAMFVVFILST